MSAPQASASCEPGAAREDETTAMPGLREQPAAGTAASGTAARAILACAATGTGYRCGLGDHAVSWLLAREPAEVRRGREQARKALCGWGLGEHAELAALIVSELVTNAIRHGGGTVRVGMANAAGDLRVDVHDDGGGRPVRRQPFPDDEAGRGLALIDALIDVQGGERWVTEDASGSGKTVCVRICLPDEDSRAGR
jgi:anti-sigma regulatory factor (Ser/Thr protein kinase)